MHIVGVLVLKICTRTLQRGWRNEDRSKCLSCHGHTFLKGSSKFRGSFDSVFFLRLLHLIIFAALDLIAGDDGVQLGQVAIAPEPVVI